MHTTWQYRAITWMCDGMADADGVAACSRDIGYYTVGYVVRVDVTFTLADKTYTTSTSFTPQQV